MNRLMDHAIEHREVGSTAMIVYLTLLLPVFFSVAAMLVIIG